MIFKAPLDVFAKTITATVTLLFIYLIVKFSSSYIYYKKEEYLVSAILFAVIFLIVYLFRPVNYVVSSTQIIVRRLIGNVVINKSDILSINKLDKSYKPRGLRIFGVGGLFGYFGNFLYFDVGWVKLYATDRNHQLLIVTRDNKKIIITPENPDIFLQEFKK
jgi:hypothetical protein